MPKGYFISVHRSPANPEKRAAYLELAGPAFLKAGGKSLASTNNVIAHENGIKEQTVIVEFEFVNYPLDKLAMLATSLVRSINLDSYLDAIKILFLKQERWVFSKSQVDELYEIGKIFGISKAKFDKIIKNYDLMQKVLNNMEKESKKFEINSTPTFIVNEKHKISGNISYDKFKEKIFQFTKVKI